MKIALIHKTFSLYGGTERYITNLSKALIEGGHEVHIFANKWEYAAGVHFHKVPMLKLGKTAKMLSFAWFTRNVVQDKRFDIVQGFGKTVRQDIFRTGGGVHRAWMKESLVAIRSPFVRKIKYLTRLLSPAQWLTLYIEGRTFREGNYRRIIAVSERVKRQIMEYYHVSSEAITVIHNGVDLSIFNTDDRKEARDKIRERFGIGDEDILLIFASTNFHLKGLEYLIRGMARIDRTLLKLLVVGGDDKGPYEKLAGSLGIGDRVVFAGKGKDMEVFYQAGDAFAYPTLYDPFANVCLEAMACGLPVITSRVNGVSDIITDGVDGLLLNDPSDDLEIADKIKSLLEDGKRVEMGKRAQNLSQRYGMERHIEKVIALYEEISSKKRGNS
ncbi:MAG: glycosyltransferase family 4 protein [Deltaproteobacteria bacterium]|nr:glycosyltransferase family 4 protein [Deltaproteobacteria bacterium]